MRTCNYGYITLLSSEDYLIAVLALNESLKRVHSKFPLVVGVTEDLYENEKLCDILRSAGCFVEKIEKLKYNQGVYDRWANSDCKSVLNTASKIALFKLTHWEKFVYIDADCIVLQNIDDLFNWPDGSMVKYEHEHGGFTALIVFQPFNHEYEYYKTIMENHPCADGDLFGKLWFQCKSNPAYQIPANYMIHYDDTCETYAPEPRNWIDYKILHFCNNPKPWQVEYIPNKEKWYMYYYQSILHKMRKKFKVK